MLKNQRVKVFNMAFLTLFTSPKPFANPHIAVIQRNAIHSWLGLGSEVEILVLGDEEGLAENARDLGVKHIKEIQRNSSGTPLISSLFKTARDESDTPLMAYVNTDILLFFSFFETAKNVLEQFQKFLLIGQRWDLDVRTELDYSANWQDRLKEDCSKRGRLHPPMGSDYFIFPRTCFEHIPDFAIGRAGWDNWMIYESRRQGWRTIDATQQIQIIHQDHDYSHLPGGQAHYRLPETGENVRLAGGKRTIFTLPDSNYYLIANVVKHKPMTWKRLIREMEIFPLIRSKSYFLAETIFYLIHPKQLYSKLRKLFVPAGKED
jgi:hypothetical protein